MTSLNNIAKIAGAGYLVIFISGIFANFFVLEGLVVAGDAAATATRIMDNGSQLRVGILSFFIMVIFDLLLVWALYLLFRPVNKDVSLLAALLRLVNVAIFGVALYHLVDVMQLSGDAEYLSAFNPAQLNAQLMLAVDAFNATWLIGLVFFGLHLIFLGCLIIKSSYVPSIIGMLLIVAAAGYLIDSFAHLLLPSYDDYATIFMLIVVVPGVIGELSLTILLLVKGFRHKMPAA
ncbi:MAG: DUF4386 domain-containing protein [Acidiferrobacterales bacterium]|jgi:hypothetical protein|nr:DUF4386 domain-containing protein [Acidiferrobacterales bacterium]